MSVLSLRLPKTLHIDIGLLGPWKLRVDGRPPAKPLAAKARALLAYLVVASGPVPRHTLAGLLWGESTEENARNSLRVTLAALRKLLAAQLDVTHHAIAFRPESATVDLHHFATAVAADESAVSPAAVSLYRGPFLDGLFIDDAPEFEAWLLAQRAHWQEQAHSALDRLANRQMAAHDYPAAVATWRRLLALEPWHEAAHRGLIRALSYQGDFSGALVQFEQCRQALAEELAVAPDAATLALFERIQAARESRPHPLPQPSTPFVGRDSELQQLLARLRDPQSRLITLVGLGGSGKTRLALEAAHRANRVGALRFLNGVVFVELTAVATPDLLPQALAAALDLPLAGPRDVTEQLVHFLRERELLLVLDNFEHLLAGHALVGHILAHCPDVKILVTSREALQLAQEWRFDFGGLSWPQSDDPAAASYDAVALFAQAARQVRPDFALNETNISCVIDICRLSGGMPLALELAAAWLRALPCEQVAADLAQSLDLLTSTRRDIQPRQRSMRAVLDATWERLGPEKQTTFAALSLFQGAFSRRAAREVVGAGPAVLAGLVDRALLRLGADGRYRIHELARQFGAEKLALSPADRARLQEQHARFYAGRLQALAPDLITSRQKEVYATMQANIGNIRAAWYFAVDRVAADLLDQMVDPLFRFCLRQGWFAEGESLLRRAIDALSASVPWEDTQHLAVLSRLHGRLGALIARIGRPEAAKEAFDRALALAQRVEEAEIITFVLIERGNLLRDQSRPTEAQRHYEEALAVAHEGGDPHSIALALDRLGSIIWDFGDHKTSVERLLESLAILRDLGNVRSVARTLNSLGNVTMSMSDHAAAERYFLEALGIAEELDERYLLDTLHINLGMLYNNLNDLEKARYHYERSLAICRRIGDEIGQAYCYTGLGQVAQAEGDLARARSLFERSLAMNERFGRQKYVAINLNMLGHVDRERGDVDAAGARFEASMAIFRRIKHEWGVATSHLLLGDIARERGDHATAREHFRQALLIAHENHILGRVFEALVHLARDLDERGNGKGAAELLSFVVGQTAVTPGLRDEAQALLEGVTAGWTEAEVAAVRERARVAVLDQVVAAWREPAGAEQGG